MAAYGLLGAGFGLIGGGAGVAGFQSVASIALGLLVWAGLLFSSRISFAAPVLRLTNLLKKALSAALRRRSAASLFLAGFLNGFLPCGLVYAACAGAAATDGLAPGMVYMLWFGAGTTPLMLALSLAGGKFPLAFRLRWQRLVPACWAVMGLLLILRGLSLGIPYVSPELASPPGSCH
jgi:hypothetical protein